MALHKNLSGFGSTRLIQALSLVSLSLLASSCDRDGFACWVVGAAEMHRVSVQGLSGTAESDSSQPLTTDICRRLFYVDGALPSITRLLSKCVEPKRWEDSPNFSCTETSDRVALMSKFYSPTVQLTRHLWSQCQDPAQVGKPLSKDAQSRLRALTLEILPTYQELKRSYACRN